MHTVEKPLTAAFDEAENGVVVFLPQRAGGGREVGSRGIEDVGDAEALVHVDVAVDEQHASVGDADGRQVRRLGPLQPRAGLDDVAHAVLPHRARVDEHDELADEPDGEHL